MMAAHNRYVAVKMFGVLCITTALLVATGCAPEPVVVPSDAEVSGQTSKGSSSDEESHSWSDPVAEFNPSEKVVELPASFPVDSLQLPASAVVDDAGEYSDSSWFVVLRAESIAQADELLQTLIADNGFVVAETVKTDDGGSEGILTATGLSVTFLTVQDAEMTLLSLVVNVS